MDDEELGLVLACCNPAKLKQFGFHRNWREYGNETVVIQSSNLDIINTKNNPQPLTQGLLDHISSFPKLKDFHIIYPRPFFDNEENATIKHHLMPIEQQEVARIFGANPSLIHVGVGNCTVWGRGTKKASEGLFQDLIIPELVQAGWEYPTGTIHEVSRFFDAGPNMPRCAPKQDFSCLAQLEKMGAFFERQGKDKK